MPDQAMFPKDATIALNDLFGLSDALSPYVEVEDRIGALWVVLGWCANRGFLSPRPDAVYYGGIPPIIARAVWPEPPGEPIAEDIPAGPQAHPETAAAGDLNTEAAVSVDGQGPEGAEGVNLSPVEAPATPVAGGVAPEPEVKGGRPPLWTREEDRKAVDMRIAGHSPGIIAAALGRPVAGTEFRLRTVLKPRLEDARRAVEHGSVKVHPDKEVALEPPVPGAAPAEEAAPKAGAAAVEETAEGGVTAASPSAVDIPAPAPPFDPSRPGWWRAANSILNALGYRRPFSAQGDLQLVEDLLKGMSIDVIAADMLISAVDLKNRWRALLSAVGVPEGSRPKIDEQQQLLEILRARAVEKTLKAAE